MILFRKLIFNYNINYFLKSLIIFVQIIKFPFKNGFIFNYLFTRLKSILIIDNAFLSILTFY